MNSLFQTIRLPLLLVVSLAVTAVLASRYASLDWLLENDRWLRATIQASPVRSALLAFVLYLVVSLVPGVAGKSIIPGWLFGMRTGVIIVNTALVAAAMVTFLLSRRFLKAAIHQRFGLYLQPIQARIEHDGAFYLLTLRLAHAPFSFMNYAAGAGTNVTFGTFWWTTQLGLLPGNLIFVYAGSRLPTLNELVVSGPLGLLDGHLIAALVGSILLPWLVRRLIRLFPLTATAAR